MSSRTVLPRLSIRGSTAALVLLSLVCGRAAPPPPPKPAAPPDIASQLQGTWHFRWPATGFEADFLFRADGTFLAVGTQREGTWKVVGGHILMEQPNLEKKQIFLPIDPKGTKVHDDRKNRNIVAVKRETPAPGVAPGQVAITRTTPSAPANPVPSISANPATAVTANPVPSIPANSPPSTRTSPVPAIPANPAPVAVPAPSLVNLSPEQISAAKKATGIIVHSAGSGNAFCISESGIFVTWSRVLEGAKADSLAIVIDPGGKNEKGYPAKVLHNNGSQDLAVVKVELDQKVPPLKLGDVSALGERQRIFAFGYPLGEMRAVDAKSYPSISLNVRRIAWVWKRGYVFEEIGLEREFTPGNSDGPAPPRVSLRTRGREFTPGNSGGPALNEKGEVVGVVLATERSEIKSAIPVSQLRMLMGMPAIISVQAPKLVFEKRFDPAEFTITLDWLQPQAAEPKVSLEISSEGNTRHAAATKGADGKYHVSLAPSVKKPGADTRKLGVTLDFEKYRLAGTVEDFDLMVNGVRRPLSKITSIERPAGSGTFTVDGKPGEALPELGTLNIEMGGAVVTVDAQKATRIQIVPPSGEAAKFSSKAVVATAAGTTFSFSYKALVTTASGTTYSSEARELALEPPKDSPQPQRGATAQLAHTREFPLSSPAHDVVTGAGGRVLVLHLWELKKLAVFDVVDLKIRGYIDLTTEPAHIAAGLKHILVAYPDQNTMQRYSIETLQAERTITSPFTGKVTNVTMGYSSPRIAMVCSRDSGMRAFDTETMAVTGSSDSQPRQSGDHPEIRASADGRTYGCGPSIITFRNGQLSRSIAHGSEMEGLVVPNADGSLIFTYSGVYTPNSVPVVKSNGTPAGAPSFFPSYHPAYFFGVPLSRWFIDTEARPKPVVIYMSGSSQPLFYLPEAFGEMFEKYDPNKGERADPIPMDKRYHFYPQFNLFLTIPPTNDKIVAHPVNVRQVLIEKGTDYLYVTSTAPEARAGAFYHYHLEAESKVGGISFALRSGPEGLVVKEDGNLGWMVPAKAVEESVIVSVKDLSGQEILHTFSIAITN